MPGRIIGALGAGLWLIAAVVAAGPASASGNDAKPLKNGSVCASATAEAERAVGLPAHLLRAVALAESGRWDEASQASFAWPWTVTSGAEGEFFRTKAEAIAAVRRMQARGVTNIDVGCLQINLRYHPDAFDSLDAAFDPRANALYAARMLRRLRTERRSWAGAVAHYHSARKALGERYRAKVFGLWKDVRLRSFRNAREIQLQAYLDRRARVLAARARRQPVYLSPVAARDGNLLSNDPRLR